MRVIIQRVSKASVSIDGQLYSTIGSGLLVLVGIEDADQMEDIDWLTSKLVNLRIFGDGQGAMTLCVSDVGGQVLVVSQFTLFASIKKGNRPSFLRSAKPDIAVPLYELFLKTLELKLGKTVSTGVFGADMKVDLLNDGPVTIWMDSKSRE